jgi:asparagine synthase (glutamine-hydrolysing)
MCGVSAIVSFEPADLSDAISRMVSVMHHRGPDGQGAFLDAATESTRLALGHNRLSILDLTDHAAQPMRSRDGRYRLIYNGEVYNYREIAQELDPEERPDVGFGDTAVVLASLIKWGPAALSKFNGMWAIVLYDAHEKTLLVSRDRFGVKPLYTYREGARLYLASEIKAILAACGSRLAINPRAAVPYLTRGLLNFSDDTFFDGVRQFPAASYQMIDLRAPGEAPIARFWRHPVENGEYPIPGRVTPDELESVFLDAVKLRLRSDVPVGILLSGGVDSSAILGGIAKLGALDNLNILSMTTGPSKSSEERFIDMMARHVAINPSKVNVSHDPIVLLERLSDACWFNDEPVYGLGNITHLTLMEVARSLGITVLLSGQGADEQLGGYNKFLYFWLMDLWKQGRPVRALTTLAQSAARSNTLYEFKLSEAIRYIGRKRLASDSFIGETLRHFDDLDLGMGNNYAERELTDVTKLSIPALLHSEDRMSMSQSLEIRLPFMDFRLVERLARVHPSEKFEGGWSKSIFRKAIGGLVPKGIQYRKDKKGFTVPENAWMRGPLKPFMVEMFRSNTPMVRELGLVDMGPLRALHARFLAGKGYLSGRPFFRVFALETFLRRFAASISV